MQQGLDNRVSSVPLEDVFVDIPKTVADGTDAGKCETRRQSPETRNRLATSGSLCMPQRPASFSPDSSIQTPQHGSGSMRRSSSATEVNEDLGYATRTPSRSNPSARIPPEPHDNAPPTFGLRIVSKSPPSEYDMDEMDYDAELGTISPILSANSFRSLGSKNPIIGPISATQDHQRHEPWTPRNRFSFNEPASQRNSGRYSWFYQSFASRFRRTKSTSTSSQGQSQKDVIPPSILALDEIRDSSNILSLRQNLLAERGLQIAGDQDWETVAESQNFSPVRDQSQVFVPFRKATQSSLNNRSSHSSLTYGGRRPHSRSSPSRRRSVNSRGRCSRSSFGSNSRRNAINRYYQLHRTTSSCQSIMLPDFKLRSGAFSRVGSLAGPIPRLSATWNKRRRITPPSQTPASFHRQSKPLKPSHRHPFKVTPPMLLLNGLRKGRHLRQKLNNRPKFLPRPCPSERISSSPLSCQNYDFDNETNCSANPSTDWWTVPSSNKATSVSLHVHEKNDITGKSAFKVIDRPSGQPFDAADLSDNPSEEVTPLRRWYRAVNNASDPSADSPTARYSHNKLYRERHQSDSHQSSPRSRSPHTINAYRSDSLRRLQSHPSPRSSNTSSRFLSNNPFARLATEEQRESAPGRHASTFLDNIPERRPSSDTNANDASPPVVNVTIPSTREIGGWRRSMLPTVPPPARSNRNSISSVTFRQHRRGTLSNDMVRKRLSYIDTSGLSEAATRRASCQMSPSYQDRPRRSSAVPLRDMQSWARASCSGAGVGPWETRRISLDPRYSQQYLDDRDQHTNTVDNTSLQTFSISKEWYSSVNGRYAFPQPPRLVHNDSISRSRRSNYVTELPLWQSSNATAKNSQHHQRETSYEQVGLSHYYHMQKRCGKNILFVATLVPILGWLVVGRIGFGGINAAGCLMRWCSNNEVLWFRREEKALARRLTMLYGLVVLIVIMVVPAITSA